MAFEKNLIMPGEYSPGNKVACDERRCEFDLKNDQVVHTGADVSLVLIGDSITHFFDNDVYLQNYGVVLNRGIGGDEAQFVAWRFKADVVQLKPRLCVSLIGINNTWTLDSTKDAEGHYNPEEAEKVIKLICDSYKSMLAQADEAGFDLWICSVLPLGREVPNYEEQNRLVVKINSELKALAEEYSTKYVDYHSAFLDKDTLAMRDGISREGCHPNGAGYEILAGVLKPLLDKYFK